MTFSCVGIAGRVHGRHHRRVQTRIKVRRIFDALPIAHRRTNLGRHVKPRGVASAAAADDDYDDAAVGAALEEHRHLLDVDVLHLTRIHVHTNIQWLVAAVGGRVL